MAANFDGIIFDLDGTLLDTLTDLGNAGNKTLLTLGLPAHEINAYKAMVGRGIKNLVINMLPEANRQKGTIELAYNLFNKNYERHMNDHTRPYPGINELIIKLKENNIKLGIMSNKAHEYVGQIAEDYFPGLFNIAMGHSDMFPPKPDPQSTIHIIDYFNMNKSRILYCGDSDVDMHTAKNAGLTACGVLWGFRKKDELISSGADITVSNSKELEEYILNSMD